MCHRKDGICASGICPCSFWPLFLGNVMMKQWILAGYTSLFHKLTDKMRVSSISSIKKDIEYSNQRDEIDINQEKHGLGPEVWVKSKDYPWLIKSLFWGHPLFDFISNSRESTGNRITISNGQMGGSTDQYHNIWLRINDQIWSNQKM